MDRTAVAWLLVVVSGLIEVGWSLAIARSEGFTRLWPTVVVAILTVIGFTMLARAATVLPISVAYAVWVGIGAAGTAVLGIGFLGEPAGAMRIASIALIVVGVIGLKLAD